MNDPVTVRCSTCGSEISELKSLSGSQLLECDYCEGISRVAIGEHGDLDTRIYIRGRIPKNSGSKMELIQQPLIFHMAF
jgi:DNA-directed RNA polymerase subunit RPC12/RpoP